MNETGAKTKETKSKKRVTATTTTTKKRHIFWLKNIRIHELFIASVNTHMIEIVVISDEQRKKQLNHAMTNELETSIERW